MEEKREIRASSRDESRLRNHFNIDKKRRSRQHYQDHAHFHPFYELFYVVNGHCRFFLYSSSVILEAGDLLIIPPGQYHYNVYEKEPFHDRFTLYFDETVFNEDLRKFLPILTESEKHASVFHVEKMARTTVQETLERMLLYYREADEYSDTILQYIFPAFMLYLARNTHEPELVETEPVTAAMQDTVRFIHEHYAEDMTLSDAASKAGLAPTYFSRKFKEVVGTGFRDYLTYVRLREAGRLLRTTRIPISEISLRCGFNSSNYFGDAFRKAYGISPRQYRQSEDDPNMPALQGGYPKISM